MERHLAAFKAAHLAVTGDRAGALHTAAGCFAAMRANASADAFLDFLLPDRWFQITKIHVVPYLLVDDGQQVGQLLDDAAKGRRVGF